MGGHIVTTLIQMQVIRLVFRHGVVEEAFKVHANIPGGVFIDGQGSRGMLDEDMHRANLDPLEFWKLTQDFVRDQMESPGTGFKRYFFLYPHGLKIRAVNFEYYSLTVRFL